MGGRLRELKISTGQFLKRFRCHSCESRNVLLCRPENTLDVIPWLDL
ncbi:hypothetical protein [Rickettsia felis]|nr:hypothetical protein [Rickettsia felis]